MTNTQQPNIVLLVLDTHRYDRLSLYGYDRETSPNIDAFGHDATVFENAISPAQWTIPAHASLFTGEYPSTHQTTQAHYQLHAHFDSLATLLSAHGYQTTGFCNNPLVGVLKNGLKRGFDKFYNYGGAFPSVPYTSNRLPNPVSRLWEWYTQLFRKWSYPFQNAIAHSDFLFRLFMNPYLVPLWTRFAHYKGNTVRCLNDVQAFLHDVQQDEQAEPQFLFINLMETHLPFTPPDTFIHRFAPYFKENRTARDFIRKLNRQAFLWNMPIAEPFTELESQVLSDLYDAEVNYQDHLLETVLKQLSEGPFADNTLTIIVGDHGEGLGEHDFMGHSFVTYEELVHVPLIVRFPNNKAQGERISTPVSTRRIFHTALAAAGIQVFETEHRPATDVKQLSLDRTVYGQDPEQGLVFSEAYVPESFLSMMKSHFPHLIDHFHCNLNRRAVYLGHHKLARIDSIGDEIFDLSSDPEELHDLHETHADIAAKLVGKLDAFMVQALARRPDNWEAHQTINLEEDESLLQQLRALGYIE
ncbi:MAG: sulfatase [Chloroflexota bacterium]